MTIHVAAAPFELVITPTAGGSKLTGGDARLVNRAGETWMISRLSYLVSSLSFRSADGTWRAVPGDPAWMSLTEGRMRWTIPEVPAGEWTAVRFDIGLPTDLNERDPAAWPPTHPLNPNFNGLHWSWQGGYIFLALEGRFWKKGGASDAAVGFAYHLARDPYRTTVAVPANFRVDADLGGRLGIAFAMEQVIDGANSVSFSRDGTSTHSNDGDPLAAALSKNLPGAFGATSAEGTLTDSPTKSETASISSFPIPPSFPRPDLPSDNLPTPERAALGKRLFFETALSRSGVLSCASCHLPANAFADPRRFSAGESGRLGKRNAMPLFNLAWKSLFFWDGRVASLREQVLVPIESHEELDESIENVIAKLGAEPGYDDAFTSVFGKAGMTADRIALALEAFLLTLVSHDSKFDRARRGEAKLSELEQRGFDLFMTEREPRSGQFGGDCFHCHGGALFTDHQFRNNGLKVDPADYGRSAITGSSLDAGAFATPSLRNIALTAPYMHDGRFATLEEVLDHYSEGVERTATLDPNLAKHPDGGLGFTEKDKAALAAFLRSLTDDQFARLSSGVEP